MHYGEFRRVEEAAGIQAIHGNEITPILAAVAEIKARVGGAESYRTTR